MGLGSGSRLSSALRVPLGTSEVPLWGFRPFYIDTKTYLPYMAVAKAYDQMKAEKEGETSVRSRFFRSLGS